VERFSSGTLQKILNNASIDYFEVPYLPLSAGASNSPIPNVKTMHKLLNKVDFDILYFSNAYAFQDLLMYFLKRMHNKPIISAQHAVLFQGPSLHDLYVNTLGKSLKKKFDAHHVLNTQDMQTFHNWGLNNIYLIPNGVDTLRFTHNEHLEKQTKFRVLFVGRLTSQKGISTLCESITLINSDDSLSKNVEFVIVGSGPMMPIVHKLTNRYTNVNYLGRVTEAALPKIYGTCDILIMPSRRETFPIVALEAQACGLPIIASDIPGLRDIIINYHSGTLISPPDPLSFAQIIKKYYALWLHDYEQYKQIRIHARNNVVKRFEWNVIIKQIYRMLTTVHTL
jgi:glycosyltransferase involved in cell wall biosynthesis